MMTTIKYTTGFLTKLEDLVSESDYILRYEKGNFKSGYCLLKDQKVMIVNKFYTTEGKINTLLDILKLSHWILQSLQKRAKGSTKSSLKQKLKLEGNFPWHRYFTGCACDRLQLRGVPVIGLPR
jgi:hypothetical protein